MYYGARFYDPALGRFSSADTLIPEQTQGTQAWDRYAYVNNSPIRNADPTGHIGEDCGDNPETCKEYPTTPPPPNVYQASFQMFPVIDPYYYGQSAEESYTGFIGSGDNGSWASAATGLPSLFNDLAAGITPTVLRKTTAYTQVVSVNYDVTYQGIPRNDAERIVTATSLIIQNNSSINSAIHYSVGIGGTERPFVATASAAPSSATSLLLPSIKVPSGGLNISIAAFTGCTGPCVRTKNPSSFQGFINFVFNP